MREALEHMPFVYGAYVVTIISTLLLVVQSWLAMKRAEARRDEVKRK